MHGTYEKAGFIFKLDSAQGSISIIAGGPTQFCPGDSVLLTATGSGPFLWSNGATTQSIYAQQPGAYQVQDGGSACASLYSAPVYVLWHNAPSITFTGPTQFCEGDSVLLTATGNGPFLWNTGETTQSIYVDTTGSYQVQDIGNSCAFSSVPVSVIVNSAPVPVITYAFPNFFSTPATSYQWYLNGVPIAGDTLQQFTPVVNGTYEVTVGYANGCSNTSAPYTITDVSVGSVRIAEEKLSVRPNPAHNEVFVQLQVPAGEKFSLSMVNATGGGERIITVSGQQLSAGVQLSLEGFAPGVYFIRITGEHASAAGRVVVL
jgi:hypothetical protein